MKSAIISTAFLLLSVGCSAKPEPPPSSQLADTTAKPASKEYSTLAIRWTGAVTDLGLETLADIDAVMSQPVKLALDGRAPMFVKIEQNGIPPGLRGEPVERIEIVNCDDYFALAGRPYVPSSDTDMLRTMPFCRICDTLRLLSRAEPARHSFVDTFQLTTDTIGEVLPLLGMKQNLPSLDADNPAYVMIEPKGPAEALPDGRIRIRGLGDVTIVELLAWADFNHDGLEDALLFVEFAAAPHARWSYHRAVTRREAGGAMEAVEVNAHEGLPP